MKKIYILFIVLFSFSAINAGNLDFELLSGETRYDGSDTDLNTTPYTTYTYNKDVIVNDGAIYIVYGNLSISSNGSSLAGTVIVFGDLSINNTDIVDGGNIVVFGEVTISGSSQQVDVDSSVSIYAVNDPDPSYLEPDVPESTQKDADDLYSFLEDPANAGTDLVNVIEGLEDAVEIVAGNNQIVWDGGTNTDWTDPTNWKVEKLNSSGVVIKTTEDVRYPSSMDNVVIEDVTNDPIISGDVVVDDLTISANGALTIEAGSHLTINGDLSVDASGTLTVNNTSASPASIIIDGDVGSSIASVNWTSLESGRWWYMSYSVASASSISGTDNAYYFDNSSSEYPTWVSGSGTGVYDAIAVKITSGATFTYTGVFNNSSSYTFDPGEGSGVYYSFGNPYPSYIDFEAICDDASFTNFAPTYYIFTDAETYGTYNAEIGATTGSGDLSQYIAPGQSVWIKTNNTSASLLIDKSYCSHQSGAGAVLKSTKTEDDRDIIRMNLTNGSVKDEALILFADFGSESFTDCDSQKKFSNVASGNISTIKDGKYAVINSMPTVYNEEVVPLSVYFTNFNADNEYTLQVSELSGFDDNISIYLYDSENEDLEMDLREVKEYTFKPTKALSNDRFQIKLKATSVATDLTDEGITEGESDVEIYSLQQKAIVKVDEEALLGSNKAIYVYNVAGQLVYQSELNKYVTEIDLPQLNTIYIVKVMVDGESYQKKVIAQ